MDQFKKWYKEHEKEILETFFKYLSFESISSLPEKEKEMQDCANFVIELLSKMGFETRFIETGFQPCIFAEKKAKNPKAPILMFYGHYDVQPVDPLELWKSPPFKPTLKEGKIYARGAADNKGLAYYTLTALKAYLEIAKLDNVHVKFLIEGGEEVGSHGLAAALKKHKELMKADYLLIVDCGLETLKKPAITLGMRGIATFEARCKTAATDLHSGEWGGIAQNSIKVLTRVLNSIVNEKGKILIDGFYDDVKPISKEEKEAFFTHDLDKKELKEKFGIHHFENEEGYSLVESGTARPTFEINGILGGYTGAGFKTVIPQESMAKVSFRLVPHQTGDGVHKMLERHFQKHMPEGVEWSILQLGDGPYYRADPNSVIASISRQAYSDVFGMECQNHLAGGSIPIASDLHDITGAEVIGIGTTTSDNAYHAPNEFIYLESLEKGFLTIVRILDIIENRT